MPLATMCPFKNTSASASSLLEETQADGSFQYQVSPKCCHISTLEVQTLQSWQLEATQIAQQRVLPYHLGRVFSVSCLSLRGQTAEQMLSKYEINPISYTRRNLVIKKRVKFLKQTNAEIPL